MQYTLTFLLSLTVFCVDAQFAFEYDQSIPVKEHGKMVAMPWAGGLNSIQYNTIDLNVDGVEDLVLFDRTSNKISTYLAEGNNYVYAPNYETFFPKGMRNWVIMRDYDCDGKKDIFTSSPFGVTLYQNVSIGKLLSWKVSVEPLTTLGTESIINLKINGTDIPAIEDIDGDGDLDILAFGFNGGGLQYHQNFSIERTGSCSIPDLERITTSWGGFIECGCDTFAFNGESCPPSGGRQFHVGGKSLLAYDMDGDGDMEIVLGEEGCRVLYLLENKGTATNPVLDSFVAFPDDTNQTISITFPAAYLVDVNFDGKKEVLISPNHSLNTISNFSDFQNSSWMYYNTGSNKMLNFQFNSYNFLQKKMIDHGSSASVAFVDEEGDDDLDMLVTSHGQIRPRSKYHSSISLYRNIGTRVTPSFVLENDDYLALSNFELHDMKLQIVDMNADGNKDLVVATTLRNYHFVFYLLNRSSTGLDFDEEEQHFINIRILSFDSPYFFDVNQDGLVDLLIGKSNGNLAYFRNVGTREMPNFQLETDHFYGIEISFTNRNLIPTVGDLNGDSNVELITIDDTGQLTIYDDFLNHINSPQEGITDVYFNNLTKTSIPFRLGVQATPVLADLQGSGTPFIALGTVQGGVQLLQNTEAPSPNFEGLDKPLLSIFPNPGTVNVNNGIIEIATKAPLSVKIISVLGKEVYPLFRVNPLDNAQLPIDILPSGMYIVVGERNGKIVDQVKFIVAN